jgi:hypothetical protein
MAYTMAYTWCPRELLTLPEDFPNLYPEWAPHPSRFSKCGRRAIVGVTFKLISVPWSKPPVEDNAVAKGPLPAACQEMTLCNRPFGSKLRART